MIYYDLTPHNNVSCPNVQTLHWTIYGNDFPSFDVSPKSLHDVLFYYSCLQTLKIGIHHYSAVGSLIQLIFCHSSEQGVWKNIGGLEMMVWENMNGFI